uniref:Uncharacterized protein n=1 Tax=Arundo donax TaxID=35708 RepID=A0A0A9HNB1_ARUDO
MLQSLTLLPSCCRRTAEARHQPTRPRRRPSLPPPDRVPDC